MHRAKTTTRHPSHPEEIDPGEEGNPRQHAEDKEPIASGETVNCQCTHHSFRTTVVTILQQSAAEFMPLPDRLEDQVEGEAHDVAEGGGGRRR